MLYRYEALDARGKRAAGTAEAGSPADARALLRDRGLMAFRLEGAVLEKSRSLRPKNVSWLSLSGKRLDLLCQSTRHLALLLRTGLPPAGALGILAEQVDDRSFTSVLEDVACRVREGTSVDDALALYPGYFPDLYVHVVRAGTQAGELPRVLLELAAYYARQKKLRDRVVSALTYPALMCLVGLFVLVFLLTFVVPKVTEVLLSEKRALPWPTQVLLAVSGFVTERWWVLLPTLVLLALGFGQAKRSRAGRRVIDRVSLRIPVVGDLFRKQAVARWAGTMATLLASGIPVAQALAVVRGTAGSEILAQDVARLEKEVLEGASLSESLKRSPILPKSVGFVAGVGEESGELDQVLREVAESFNEEVEVTSGRLTELLNPVLIVFLGLVVGFIVAAILLPITDFSRIH
jgi:type II secretory pathway component PulF